MSHRLHLLLITGLLGGMVACEEAVLSPALQSGPQDETDEPLVCSSELPYATVVLSYDLGENAGMGTAEEALGPPEPGSPMSGSMRVLSLGIGGQITLGFGGREFEDGPGADLIIWENAFWIGGDPQSPFTELGEVSVSEDGETWTPFPCDPLAEDALASGCAGIQPRQPFEICETIPLESDVVGGDTFDLADIGVERARYVRIRDLAQDGEAPSAGFDLDAIGAVYFTP
jgi:hypothetical protein